jgi:hypothetical protein
MFTSPIAKFQGVLQSILQHTLTILPQAKWSPAGGFYPLAIVRSTQKGPQGRDFSLFSRQVLSALIQICCFATAS